MSNVVVFGLCIGFAIIGTFGFYLLDKLIEAVKKFSKDVKEFRDFKKERDYWLDHELSVEEWLELKYFYR